MGYERFTMFDNWGEIFDELPDEDALALFRGMYRYAFKGVEPKFEKGSALSLTWKAIKPNIDSSGKAARNGGAKGSEKTSPKGSEKTPAETPEKGSEKGPEETPSEQKKGKEREGRGKGGGKNLPLEEDSFPTASGGAAAGEPAPPSAVDCPRCGVPMERTNAHRGDSALFRCPLCAEEVWT